MDTVFIHIARLRLWEETAVSEKQFWVKVRALSGQVGVRARLLGSLYPTTDQCSLGLAIPRCLRFGRYLDNSLRWGRGQLWPLL